MVKYYEAIKKGGEVKDAMNKLKKKLNSDRGASITWALLIFLVCAVVGSVVLVAGTAAAGRMSKLPENDQRFYAVTSTAGLLRDILGKDITVTRTATETTSDSKYNIQYESGAEPLLKALVREMMDWPEPPADPTSDKTLFWEKDEIAAPTANPVTISLTGQGASLTPIGTVSGQITLGSDGSIIAEIGKENYRMRLTFELKRTIVTNPNVKEDTFTWILKEARTLSS